MNKRIFKGSAMLNPVPVVLVTSKNKDGKENVFTVAWTGTACTKPPMVTISIRKERLSYDYIKESGEFAINLPSKNLVKEVDFCGVRSGKDVDKIKHFNFSLSEGKETNVPLIDDCPVSLECRVREIIELGSHDLFLADILSVHVDEDLIDEKGKIHYEEANLLSYCHGEYYSLPKKSLGKFGFSVQKKKKNNKKKK